MVKDDAHWYHEVHQSLFRMQKLAEPYESTNFEAFCCLHALAIYSSVGRFFDRNVGHGNPGFIVDDCDDLTIQDCEDRFKRILAHIETDHVRATIREQFSELIDGMMAN